jgi:AmmeMemoRadiSam system protein B
LLTPTHDLLIKKQRPEVCAGNSYPSDPIKLKEYLDHILLTTDKTEIKNGADTIIVPHIDYQIGEGSHRAYSAAYNAIRDTKADLFVIFGTSHYGNSARFMMTERDFHTPLGVVKNDLDLLHKLQKVLSYDLTIDEMAHRLEHSIELQVVLLKHIFGDRNFTVLPVLIGSFHDFIMKKTLPSSDKYLIEFLEGLKKVTEESGRKTVYIASVDFAHIGRRFDDDFDAEEILDQLRIEDEELIRHLSNANYDDFFSAVSSVGDSRRICGLSPIYSMLKLREKKSGELLHYHQWNDKPTKSAVTFASIAYYE